MLKLAVAAQLPIVAVNTRDTMNLPEVLRELTNKTPVKWEPTLPIKAKTLHVYYWPPPNSVPTPPLFPVYEKMVAAESTLIVVNPLKVVEPMFDAGEVPVPKTLVFKFMKAIVENDEKAEELLRGLGGCTLKEAAELCRLTMARDNSLTVNGLMVTRKQSFQGSRGLTQVDTNQPFYSPPDHLIEWLLKEKPFFLTGSDPRLMPRGLLMDGPPGTGKTAASKWIANQLGVPLYRVDIGGTKNKYVGESENQLLNNLQRLDHEEPCVALLDEVEKIFSTSVTDSSGTTSTMMSQMLWWLAERKTRVLVVMTTNNAKALPKELHREGRIDRVLVFEGLDYEQAPDFVSGVMATFKKKPTPKTVKAIVDKSYGMGDMLKTSSSMAKVSQAALKSAVYAFIKDNPT